METFIASNPRMIEVQQQAAAEKQQIAARFWEKAEFNRFGILPMLLVGIVCLAGIAGAKTVGEHGIVFGVVILSTVVVETAAMVVAPMKVIVAASAVAVLIDLVAYVI